METGQAFSVVVLSSALGGLIHSVVRPRATQLLIPASTKAVKLGSAGDVIIGVGAGLAIFFVAGALFGLEIDSAKGPNDLLRIVALGVISGFTGIRLLNTMSDQLLKKVESIDEKMQGLQDELRFRDQLMRGHFSMDSAPDRSLAIFDAILAVEPNHTGALASRAMCLKRLGRLPEAVQCATRVLELKPELAGGHYNAACYKNLSGGFPKTEILAHLTRAIELQPSYREYAVNDEDLQTLRDDPEFIRIVRA